MVDNNDNLAYPTPDSPMESLIQRTIDGIQKMIKGHDNQGPEEDGAISNAGIEINPAMKRHWESEIKILRDAPRVKNKLSEIIKIKQEEYEEADDSEDIERLVSEIEMLKFVLFLVRINGTTKEHDAC